MSRTFNFSARIREADDHHPRPVTGEVTIHGEENIHEAVEAEVISAHPGAEICSVLTQEVRVKGGHR